jgi:dinuclear metal center YbgI/SA1388 family protein
MAVSLQELVNYTNTLLDIEAFSDYCPNGLQVQGSAAVSKIITGVTASEALIDKAIALNADAIIVHHGYFWRGEEPSITGMKANRIRKLMVNNISLLAYHLPLDAHFELGNNAQLAKVLDFEIRQGLDDGVKPMGLVGELKQVMTAAELVDDIASRLGKKGLLIGNGDKAIRSVAWCTGAAQSYIEKAIAKGVDCFITGEISEQTVHIAREMNICFISAGHHATERYGVKALGEHLSVQLGVGCEFIDIDNPV